MNTHLDRQRDRIASDHKVLGYHNPSSRLGGVRFFRQPPTESTAVFEIAYTDTPQP